MKKNNIKTRIFVLQLIVILIPFIIFNVYQYNETKFQLESEQLKLLDLKVLHVESLMNHYAEELETYAMIIANTQEIQEAVHPLRNEKKWDEKDIFEQKNYPQNGFGIFSKKEYDSEITNLRDVTRKYFNKLNEYHSYIGNIEIINLNSVVIMRGHRDKRGDIKTDKLIKDAVKGYPTSGYLVSKRTGQPAIDGTAPIYFNGDIVGGVKVGMYITEQVTNEIEKEVGVKLLNFDHDILVEISEFDDEKTINSDENNLYGIDCFEVIENSGRTTRKLKDDIYRNYILKDKSYTMDYCETESGNYAIRITPIKDYDGLVIGAHMVVVENDHLLDSLNLEKSSSTKRILIILVMSLVISYIVSNQIGNPIVNFKHQLHKMKMGDSIDYLEEIYGPQELLEMAFEFNSLVDAISFEKNRNDKLEIISNVDGLTNLYNHRKFYQDIKVLIKNNHQFALIFMDLDKFKSINDRLGHSVGDTILREVSNLLKNFEVGKYDDNFKSYRYGGEEFAILLDNHNREEAYVIADKIRKMIESSHILKGISAELDVTTSAGIAVYPTDAQTESEVVENADMAMYYSKKTGRNRTTLYNERHKIFFMENSDDSIKGSKILDSIKSLINALETRDKYSAEHSRNVMAYAMMFGRKLGFDEANLEKLKYSSLLHDCGKLGISDSILMKKGALTKQEYRDVTKHTVYGYNIINNLSNDMDIKHGVLYHHENWDGSGYPEGLAGREIPLIARIISIVGSYQAMISNRPYREAMTHEKALKEIRNNKGIMYDPNLVDIFLKALNEDEFYIENMNELEEDKKNSLIMEPVETSEMDKGYEHSNINVMKIDKNYLVKFINQSALEKIEKGSDEVLNGTCYSGIIGRNKPCDYCKVQDVLKTRNIQYQVKQEVINSGVVRKIAQVWVPVIDNNNVLSTILEVAIEFDCEEDETNKKNKNKSVD